MSSRATKGIARYELKLQRVQMKEGPGGSKGVKEECVGQKALDRYHSERVRVGGVGGTKAEAVKWLLL